VEDSLGGVKESRYEGGGDRKVGRLLSRSLKGAVEEIEE